MRPRPSSKHAQLALGFGAEHVGERCSCSAQLGSQFADPNVFEAAVWVAMQAAVLAANGC
jgi:hypothetical protein